MNHIITTVVLTFCAYLLPLVPAQYPILENIYFTSYNPEAGQTDETPCIAGGTGYDLCAMYLAGERPIAFSQDLVEWAGGSPLKAGDVVELRSKDPDPRCNGEFTVADSLNARYTMRGDIFFIGRENNVSCTANVYKK